MEYLFKDKASMYIFALLYADGNTRSRILNITEELYCDEFLARQWFKDIYSVIKDYPDMKLIFSATQQLEIFYDNMTRE